MGRSYAASEPYRSTHPGRRGLAPPAASRWQARWRQEVGAADVMQRDAHAGEAPGLVDAQVGDKVWHAPAEAAGIDAQPVVVDERAAGEEARSGDVDRAEPAGGRIFERQGAGEAVAELSGIGPEVLTRCTGVTRDAHVVIAVRAAVGDEI